MLYPKIGIRPTIDGRWGGVRESLEEQTMAMAMAKNAKALIEEHLRYPDGTPSSVCWRTPPSAAGPRRPPAPTSLPPSMWWPPSP